MKKSNNYSTQYKIISRSFATANTQNFTRSSAEQLHNQNQNHGKNTTKLHKKTLSKDRQEFINNISASGFKQFQA